MENTKTEACIETLGLNVFYNKGQANEFQALENINLRIYPNEYAILYGPSGCGKSTLLYSIAGFQQPAGGNVIVQGREINSLSKKEKDDFHRTKIGVVFQSFFLIPTLNVLDNVCLPQAFLGVDAKARREEGMKLLERFGIAEQAHKFPAALSGGQRQRVAIARALINNPDIIIADEPSGNLDSKSAFNVMSILTELNEKDQKTVILVTHDPNDLRYGSRIFHMHDGKIVKTEEILERKKMVLIGGEEEIVRKEMLSPDLKMLMRSFKDFSPSQLGMLLIPFKSQELLPHIFFSVPGDQIATAKAKLQEVLSGRATIDDFQKLLDEKEEAGGLGWDKRSVEKIVLRLKNILEMSSKIDSEDPEKSAGTLLNYLSEILDLRLDDQQQLRLKEAIRARLENDLSILELRKALDRPVKAKGLGFDKRIAKKIARELEIIMLIRYTS